MMKMKVRRIKYEIMQVQKEIDEATENERKMKTMTSQLTIEPAVKRTFSASTRHENSTEDKENCDDSERLRYSPNSEEYRWANAGKQEIQKNANRKTEITKQPPLQTNLENGKQFDGNKINNNLGVSDVIRNFLVSQSQKQKENTDGNRSVEPPLKVRALNKRNEAAIASLYSGMPCNSDGTKINKKSNPDEASRNFMNSQKSIETLFKPETLNKRNEATIASLYSTQTQKQNKNTEGNRSGETLFTADALNRRNEAAIASLYSSVPCNSEEPKVNKNLNLNELINSFLDSQKRVKEENKSNESNFNPEALKKRNKAAIGSLYNGIACSNCSMRFDEKETSKYRQHLDYHFRQNRREREMRHKLQRREWYCNVSAWMQYTEFEYEEDRKQTYFELEQNKKALLSRSKELELKIRPQAKDAPICTANSGQNANICSICDDTFDMFFDEDTEEWQLRNAVRINDKLYHPVCHQDHSKKIVANNRRFI